MNDDAPDLTPEEQEQMHRVVEDLRRHCREHFARPTTISEAKATLARALADIARAENLPIAWTPRFDVEMEGTVIRWWYLAADDAEADRVRRFLNGCILPGEAPIFDVQREEGTERLKTFLLPAPAVFFPAGEPLVLGADAFHGEEKEKR